jgi:hypothetical protein
LLMGCRTQEHQPLVLFDELGFLHGSLAGPARALRAMLASTDAQGPKARRTVGQVRGIWAAALVPGWHRRFCIGVKPQRWRWAQQMEFGMGWGRRDRRCRQVGSCGHTWQVEQSGPVAVPEPTTSGPSCRRARHLRV